MHSFRRILTMACRRRVTVALALLSSLGVALLWGGNISFVYPLVEVVLDGKSARDWIDERLAQSTAREQELDRQLAAAGENRAEAEQIANQLGAERRAGDRYRQLAPYVHRFAPRDPFQTLVLVCVALLIGTILKSVLRVVGQILVARIAHLTALEIRNDFYRHILQMDMESFTEKGRGDLMTRFTTDLQYITIAIQTVFGSAVREPLKAAACLVGAAMVSWQLLLLTLLIAPVAGYAIGRLAKLLKRANHKALQELTGIYEALGESLGGIKLIKAYTMEPYQRVQFRRSAREFYRKSMKIARYDALVSPVTETMGLGMIVLAVLCGGYLAIHQQTHLVGIPISDRPLDRGSLMLFYALLAGAADPARRLSNMFGALQQGIASSERLYEVLDRKPSIREPDQSSRLDGPIKQIQFNKLSFSYANGVTVLQDIDLSIRAGETIAFVGPNGCGKSTLLGLLPRLYDPAEGVVTLNDTDLRNLRLRDLRGRIGMVSQETQLLNETVAENIRFGRSSATQAEIEAAAKRAHAHRFISEKLEFGYETIVGPGGSRLSGGQRQRVALARAILRDPEILILDEATSQIDLESEKLIHSTLQEFVRERTACIITHRPATLYLADRIIVMNSGRIEDAGTMNELLSRNEFLQRLCASQLRESA